MEISTLKEKKKFPKRNYNFLKYILIFLIFISFISYIQTYYLTNSDMSIRDVAAESLNMDPNEFSWRDYSKVTKLDLSEKEISDIRLISKFKNLKNLKLGNIIIVKKTTPKWKTVLQNLHIIKSKSQNIMIYFIDPGFPQDKQLSSFQFISQESLIDLNPLKKLKNLQSLSLGNTRSLKNWIDIESKTSGKRIINLNPKSIINPQTFVNTIPFKNINPISSLTSLKFLSLSNTLISDITPVKNLKNLRSLYLSHTDVNDLEPIKNLKNLRTLFVNDTDINNIEPLNELKNLESLFISSTKIDSLEPLRGLTNLTQLEIDRTIVSDINPIKELKNLHELWMYQCENITEEQVEDLQNTLPNLKIYRHLNSDD